MSDNNDYEIKELLDEARDDTSWEPDAEKRAALVARLEMVISYI